MNAPRWDLDALFDGGARGAPLQDALAALEKRAEALVHRADALAEPPAGLDERFDLAAAAGRLRELGALQAFPHFVRFQGEGFLLTLFRDGRAVFDGLTDRDQARSLYARYVGR